MTTTPTTPAAPAGLTPEEQAFVARLRAPITSGNWLRDLNPINTFVLVACLAVVAFALPGFVPSLAVCLAYVVLAALAGVGRRFASTFAKLFLVVGGILFALRAVFLDAGERLLVLGPFTVSTGGLLQALEFSLLVMALCGALTLFFTMTPMKNLMLALEARGVRPTVTYVILASFQAITDLGKSSTTVMNAQRSRGIETEGSLLTRLRSFGPILAPVFLTAMNQTEERALSLDARAFSYSKKHTQLSTLRAVPAGEVALVALAVALATAAVIGRFVL
ncbi:energy-coupling factor transporter transmembrane protein EcfT [Rothia sp. AR01]|uniref:Energy-coupling factor transporter transmembrane protein EcfT n=1 Tax=Rothia santali TaxID=2949643 RepID=A0A9X2HEF5_9MICC|nr:energy-coupling factor transporter transmembrane component T [Rothia santali]MCP3426780.1 energy-coupling factor transporter transmembrane protein EcfT [Rothia santali]